MKTTTMIHTVSDGPPRAGSAAGGGTSSSRIRAGSSVGAHVSAIIPSGRRSGSNGAPAAWGEASDPDRPLGAPSSGGRPTTPPGIRRVVGIDAFNLARAAPGRGVPARP